MDKVSLKFLMMVSLMVGGVHFKSLMGEATENKEHIIRVKKEDSKPLSPEEEELLRSIEEDFEEEGKKAPHPSFKHPWKLVKQWAGSSGETLREYAHPTKGKIVVVIGEKGHGFYKFLKHKGKAIKGIIQDSKVYRGLTNNLTPEEMFKGLRIWGEMAGDKDTKAVTVEDLIDNVLIRRRDLDFKKELLSFAQQNGVDLDEPGEEGEPPLILAVRNQDLEMMKALLEKGASVSAKDRGGNTCLHEAAKIGNKKILEELLKIEELSIDEPNQAGFTPLHLSVFHKNSKATQKLLEKGANPDLKIGSLKDVTARSLAKKTPSLERVFQEHEQKNR